MSGACEGSGYVLEERREGASVFLELSVIPWVHSRRETGTERVQGSDSSIWVKQYRAWTIRGLA